MLFESDKHQLEIQIRDAQQQLQQGELKVRRLDDRGLAIFLIPCAQDYGELIAIQVTYDRIEAIKDAGIRHADDFKKKLQDQAKFDAKPGREASQKDLDVNSLPEFTDESDIHPRAKREADPDDHGKFKPREVEYVDDIKKEIEGQMNAEHSI